jgi:hypothetical protein
MNPASPELQTVLKDLVALRERMDKLELNLNNLLVAMVKAGILNLQDPAGRPVPIEKLKIN